jgi:hypothetical protein
VARGNALTALFQGWAHANAAEVDAWAEQLPPGTVKMMAYLAAAPYLTANGGNKTADGSAGTAASASAKDPHLAIAEAARMVDREKRLAVYKSIAKEWAAADPKAATDWAVNLPIATERDALLELTASTWARRDPEQAATFLAAHSPVSNYLLQQAVSRWATLDFSAVLKWARQLPDAKRRNEVLLSLLNAWLDQAPDEAAEFIASLPSDGYEFGNAASTATRRWAETEPERVFALWRKLPPDAVARQLVGDSLQILMRSSPQHLLDFLRELPVGRRAEPYATAVVTLVAKDPEAARKQLAALDGAPDEAAIRRLVIQRSLDNNLDFALGLFGTLPAGQSQAEAMRLIADQWGRKDPAKALAWVRSLPASPLTQSLAQTIIRQLGQSDPKAALREIEKLPASAARKGAVADLVATWSAKDVAAAREYLQNMPEGDGREAALIAMAQRVGYSEPARALNWLAPADATPERMNAAQQIISIWVQNDSAAAQRWADQQSSVAVREAVLVAAIYPLSQTSPAAAATLLDRLTLKENTQRAVMIVAQTWTAFDPAAAGAWALARPAGALRDQAIGAVGGQWLQQDFAGAKRWLADLPADSVPDEVWRQLAYTVFPRQPAEAMAWAGKLKNSSAKLELLVQLAQQWRVRDAAAAEKWVNESPLPEEQKTRILTMPTRRM